MPEILESVRPILIAFGLKVLGAIVAFIVGRKLIGLAARLVRRARAAKGRADDHRLHRNGRHGHAQRHSRRRAPGLLRDRDHLVRRVGGRPRRRNWRGRGGLLSNFAAGTFILVLRPFKVGDYVMAGEVEGDVRAIGLFSTTIDTPDNVQTLVGNAKIMGGTIKNFTSNPYRRVELCADRPQRGSPRRDPPAEGSVARKIPIVIAKPKPNAEIVTFNERGPVLAVRPYCNNLHYWQVYFDTNASIRATFGAAILRPRRTCTCVSRRPRVSAPHPRTDEDAGAAWPGNGAGRHLGVGP